MARGRMISKSLSTSEKYAALIPNAGDLAEFCHALFPLLVAHSDDFGRSQGDIFTVKHQCYPASKRSLEEFATALQFMDDIELIAWYVVSGKQYIQIIRFEKHQIGLHKRTKSAFPRVPGASGNDAELPDQENLTKENRTKEKKEQTDGIRQFLEFYEAQFLERFGDKPVIVRPKDPVLVKGLLTKYGDPKLRTLMVRFLDTDDAFIKQSGYTIGVFHACLNKILTRSQKRSGGPLYQPWECPHTPKCTEGRWRCEQRSGLEAARKTRAS